MKYTLYAGFARVRQDIDSQDRIQRLSHRKLFFSTPEDGLELIHERLTEPPINAPYG